jgi:endothelin-converting enzyme/putative endopeptidase
MLTNSIKKMKIKLNKGFFSDSRNSEAAEGQAQTTTSVKEPGINVSFFDNKVKPAIIFPICKWNLA